MAKTILTPDMVCTVEKSGNRYNAYNSDGVKMTSEITTGARKNAYKGGYLLGRFPASNTNNGYSWRRVTDKVLSAMGESPTVTNTPTENTSPIEVPTDHAEVMAFIHGSYDLKPRGLMMNELKWKYLVRSAVRGKNIMMTGPAGCGKTMADKALVNALDHLTFTSISELLRILVVH